MRHFVEEEKGRAVNLFFDEQLTTQEVILRLGHPMRHNLERWLKKYPRYGTNFHHGFYPVALKTNAVEMYRSGQHTVKEIVAELKIPVSRSIFSWIYKTRAEGYPGLLPKKKRANMPKRPKPTLPEVFDKLKQR